MRIVFLALAISALFNALLLFYYIRLKRHGKAYVRDLKREMREMRFKQHYKEMEARRRHAS